MNDIIDVHQEWYKRLEETGTGWFSNKQIPPQTTPVRVLGVDYLHLKVGDNKEDDLYVTKFGYPFLEHLLPSNWYEKEWFAQSREKLLGTSTVYKTKTKEVRGFSKDLVVKWCRVGEDVPIDTFTLNKFVEAEFNSPYEEFSLVMEMRDRPLPEMIYTHKPFAIYVPAKKMKLWQTGRSQSKMALKKARHRGVELDIYRQYILIYEWIKGLSVVEALAELSLPKETKDAVKKDLFHQSIDDMQKRGFRVYDMKPEHIIIRTDASRRIVKKQDGMVPYALVDFELLARTDEYEEEVKAIRRAEYLKRQRDRFTSPDGFQYPPHLQHVTIKGVDYVYGHSESTQGALWVVGNDPTLFDYFQPERWRRTPRTKLSDKHEVYHTVTKDQINLVWKVSRVGDIPDIAKSKRIYHEVITHGYNSPFETVAMALHLNASGIPTIYPRAIYMTGQETAPEQIQKDVTRYKSHEAILTPEGQPVLRPDHMYITIWGYWNGLDELLAREDAHYCRGVNARMALNEGLITKTVYQQLFRKVEDGLIRAGMESVMLKGAHFLVTVDEAGNVWMDDDGLPAIRLCNLELIHNKVSS